MFASRRPQEVQSRPAHGIIKCTRSEHWFIPTRREADSPPAWRWTASEGRASAKWILVPNTISRLTRLSLLRWIPPPSRSGQSMHHLCLVFKCSAQKTDKRQNISKDMWLQKSRRRWTKHGKQPWCCCLMVDKKSERKSTWAWAQIAAYVCFEGAGWRIVLEAAQVCGPIDC